uniref:Uncharacterized protein n=1 Tax=Anopheles maculatus TaxID=74869 RepID=A0A182T7S5_9DIPT
NSGNSKVHTTPPPLLTNKLFPFFLTTPTVPVRRRQGRRKPFFEKFGTLLKQRSDAFLLHVNNPVPPHSEESDPAGAASGGIAGLPVATTTTILGPAGIQPIVANGDVSPGRAGDAENYKFKYSVQK